MAPEDTLKAKTKDGCMASDGDLALKAQGVDVRHERVAAFAL